MTTSFPSLRSTGRLRVPTPFLVLVVASAPALGQGPAFQSPGMSRYGATGQINQFSNEFNPAIGFVIDSFADWESDDSGGDGFDLELRILELNAAAYVDPKAWAYVSLSSEDLGSVDVEEAAVEYIGFESNSTLKAGRFFVDFGKQMQEHLEELRTLDRPLPLREYLGEELAGTGLQWDDWFAVGESPVRFSVAVFASLLPDNEDDDDGSDASDGVELTVPQNKKIDELSFTARLTGMTDVGERGQFQAGVSTRWLPSFDAEFDDGSFSAKERDLHNIVYGLDLTYGVTDETATETVTVGGEYLLVEGDLSTEVDDPSAPTAIVVNDGTAQGFYVYGDYAWNRRQSAGLQYAWAEELADPDEGQTEIDAYFTQHFSELRRLRFGVTYDLFDNGDEDWRLYVQFTNFFGNHSHGWNW